MVASLTSERVCRSHTIWPSRSSSSSARERVVWTQVGSPSAGVSSTGAKARSTRARRPRWPWERDDEE